MSLQTISIITANFHLIPPPTPLNVKIDYFGIKSTHKETYVVPPKIQLHVVVDDGKTSRVFGFPASNEGIAMEDFHLEDLRGQIVFNTASIGDYLKVSVVAYSSEDKEETLALWRALKRRTQR